MRLPFRLPHGALILGLALAVSTVAAAGCSSGGTATLPTPQQVTGTLKRADGSPVGNVTVMLQPTSTGHMTALEVDASGAFSGEVIGGPYAWFVAKSAKAEGADAALAKVPEDFQRGSLERKVTVGSGALELTIP
ncbi:MAG: carboxypeptidase-like regulatory domain-containing protein [Planctomycetaceae bacterium]